MSEIQFHLNLSKVGLNRFGTYDSNNFNKLPGKVIILNDLDLLSSNRVRLRQTRSCQPIEFRILNLSIEDFRNIQNVSSYFDYINIFYTVL